MATEPVTTEGTYSEPAVFAEEARREHVHGVGPWRLGLRRLRRNKVALAFGFLFVLLVAVCLAAPIWADKVAKTGPNENHLTDQIVIDGKKTDVVALNGDSDRADVAGRVLPRGRHERPRRDGAAPLRRAQLARDRAGGRDHDDASLDQRSASWPASSAAGPTPGSERCST